MSTRPHTQEDLVQLLQKVEEREQATRRRALLYSLVPIAVAAVLLTVTGWQVYEAEKKVAYAKAEYKLLNKSKELLKTQIEGYKATIGQLNADINTYGGKELQQKARQITPITTEVKVQASAAEEKGKVTPNGSQIYRIRLWVDGSPETLDRIAAVEYEFNHPTFVQKIRKSSDRQKKFQIEYDGWGCLSSVIVTLRLVNPPHGPPPQIEFDMCAALGWS